MVKKTTKTRNKRKFSSRHVVKRYGHIEAFDERKIYASVYEAVHACQLDTKHAEKIASAAANKIKKWAEKKEHMSTREIHKEVVKELRKHHADVAYMYDTHKVIC